jgi:hypothetical protein
LIRLNRDRHPLRSLAHHAARPARVIVAAAGAQPVSIADLARRPGRSRRSRRPWRQLDRLILAPALETRSPACVVVSAASAHPVSGAGITVVGRLHLVPALKTPRFARVVVAAASAHPIALAETLGLRHSTADADATAPITTANTTTAARYCAPLGR